MLEAYAREVIEMWDNQKPYDTNNGKRRRVFLVSGEYATVSIRTIVGYCHDKKHKGFVTKKLLVEHNCIAKNCACLECFVNYPYWIAEAEQKKGKMKRKQKIQEEKEAAAAKQAALDKKLSYLQAEARRLADESQYPIIITRISQTKSGYRNEYIVNYVSDSQFNDFASYFDMVIPLSIIFPGRYILRKVRWPDGRFVTREEWEERER